MEHFYEKIHPDWFDYQDIYTDMVNKASDGAHFVELGSHRGRSAAYMAVEIVNSGKKIKFDTVDNFSVDYGNPDNFAINGSTKEIFDANIEPVKDYVNLIVGLTVEVAQNYADESLDFVWVDADHHYDLVLADINTWYPKVKKGSWIGGHDYSGSDTSINRIVKELFPSHTEVLGRLTSSWMYMKPL